MVLLGARRPKIGGPELGARVQQKCSRELCYLTGFLYVVHVWCSRESCTFPIHGCSVWLPDLTDRLKPVGRRSSVMSLLKFRIQKIGKYRGVENRGPYPLRKNQNPLNESRHPRESCRGYDAPLHRAKSTEKNRHLLGRGEIYPALFQAFPAYFMLSWLAGMCAARLAGGIWRDLPTKVVNAQKWRCDPSGDPRDGRRGRVFFRKGHTVS